MDREKRPSDILEIPSPNQGDTDKSAEEYSILTVAKTRLKVWEKTVYLFLIPLRILAFFGSKVLGIVLVVAGLVFRNIAINNHKGVLLSDGIKLGDENRPEFEAITRPAATIKRFLFWVFAAWFILGMFFLTISIATGKGIGEITFRILASLLFFIVPAYFACQKIGTRIYISFAI